MIKKLFVIISLLIIAIGCESQEIKDAKTFIELKDWSNASEKLNQEIKNNPKNIDAYHLLFEVQRNQLFPDYKIEDFLNPRKSKFINIPSFTSSLVEELQKTFERIIILDSHDVLSEELFFNAILSYSQWISAKKALLNTESDILKQLKMEKEIDDKKCENKLVKEAISNFNLIVDDKNDLSDNAYYWLFSIGCDTTFSISEFTKQFKSNYNNSDLKFDVDLIEFSDSLRNITKPIAQTPDSSKVSQLLKYYLAFKKQYSDSIEVDEQFSSICISSIASRQKTYNSEKRKYEYSHKENLISYLNQFMQPNISASIKSKANIEIAEIYFNYGDINKSIETLKKSLEYANDVNSKDELYIHIAKFYYEQELFSEAITYYGLSTKLDDMDKYNLWRSFVENNDTEKADSLKTILLSSNNSTVKYLVELSNMTDELTKLKITNLDAEFDDYSIKVKGIVVNNLGRTVRNVKVKGTVSDKYNNNTKQSFDYIDVIYAGRKSRFEISVYYGNRTPSSIRYGARIADYD